MDKKLLNEITRIKQLMNINEGTMLNEMATGGLDPKVLYNFIEKYGTNYNSVDSAALQSVKDKELFLDDLLNNNDGLAILSGRFPNLAEILKKYNIKLNLTKANIEHPNYVPDIYNTLIKPGIINFDELKKIPNIVDKIDAQSPKWSNEVIYKLKDQNIINAVLALKNTANLNN